MADRIENLKKELQKKIVKRNKAILQEAVLGEKNYQEIADKFRVSRQRIKQILRKFHIKVPLEKGMKKYEIWRKRISKSRKKSQKN
jgi:predicted DNA-binding protein YlxM (UPF0122 family)